MTNRSISTLIVAAVIAGLIMVTAVVLTIAGWVDASRWVMEAAWKDDYANTQSMKIIDLTGDGEKDLFVQSTNSYRLYNASGEVMLEAPFTAPLGSSMGDLNGDGTDDIITFDGSSRLQVFSKGQEILNIVAPQVVFPSDGASVRVGTIRFADGAQVIVGDGAGTLYAYDLEGRMRWELRLGADYIRGLDDTAVNGTRYLAAATYDGQVAVIDSRGQAVWSNSFGELRRLRAYDLDGDGIGEIVLGGEYGLFTILDASSGASLFSDELGQSVREIRSFEIDGNPGSLEIVAGGKDGGVWAYTLQGNRLWAGSVGGKVTEIAGMDTNRDGKLETLIGNEYGELSLFLPESGEKESLDSFSSDIARLDVEKLGNAQDSFALATLSEVAYYSLGEQTASALRYTPLLAGLFAAALVMGVAWWLSNLPQKPVARMSIQDMSPEGLQAERRMIKEMIADVERLRNGGEMTSDAYLLRLKDLRRQQADNEAAMRKAGMPIKVETMQCPHCGGIIPLGTDKCEYCGQVVIS
jgi:outer membrane protein assembly factor BamB